jgi:hypothetical protein
LIDALKIVSVVLVLLVPLDEIRASSKLFEAAESEFKVCHKAGFGIQKAC